MFELIRICVVLALFCGFSASVAFSDDSSRGERRKQEIDKLQERFDWWPTDAKPAPVKDDSRGGYWWWPDAPGSARPWGNRGYVYVYKVIFDYKADELGPAKSGEKRPSLLVKKIIRNVKVYFDYDKAGLREDARKILASAVKTLERNDETSILITGNCDRRGSEAYNEKLGARRAQAVKAYMIDSGIDDGRIRIVSRGKLDAVAPVKDIIGMQKDRNAQFMIAEVEEVMIPVSVDSSEDGPQVVIPEGAREEGGKLVIEEKAELEGQVAVEMSTYIVKKNDSLWKIAARQMGSGHRWKYLYEINKDRIKNPDKLKPGTKLLIPKE